MSEQVVIGLDDSVDSEEEEQVIDDEAGGKEPTGGGAGGREPPGGGEGEESQTKEDSPPKNDENIEREEVEGDKREGGEAAERGPKKTDTKPTFNLLRNIRESNAKGLEQNPALLGP
mgnify:CR=1 FL=1